MGFPEGTISLGDKLICTYWRTSNEVCHRTLVTENCVVTPNHEANVPVKMFDNGIPHPSSDWAIEPCRLEPGVMAAQMLFSSSHKKPVAHICNYSDKPHTFKADSFLGLAKPVMRVSGTGSNSCLANSDELQSCQIRDRNLYRTRRLDSTLWPKPPDQVHLTL